MLVRGVVDDKVDDDPQPPVLGLVQKLGEVAEGADARVHAVVVADVIAVVPVGGGVDRFQPQARHAQPVEIVEPGYEPGEIPDAVAVCVLERLDV
jgi:hypothetical protein